MRNGWNKVTVVKIDIMMTNDELLNIHTYQDFVGSEVERLL